MEITFLGFILAGFIVFLMVSNQEQKEIFLGCSWLLPLVWCIIAYCFY